MNGSRRVGTESISSLTSNRNLSSGTPLAASNNSKKSGMSVWCLMDYVWPELICDADVV
jgi:hypothetical protein